MAFSGAGDRSMAAALRRRIDPRDPVALHNHAWLALQCDDRDLARASLAAAVHLPNAPFVTHRAVAALSAGRDDAVLLADASVAPTHSGHPAHPYNAGAAAHRGGDIVVAEVCYRAAVQDGDHVAAAWNGLAVLHEQRCERQAADDAWTEAGNDPLAIHNRALALIRRGAVRQARVLLAAHDDHHGVLASLAGYAALLDQDAAGALATLVSVVEATPDSARAHFTLGLACERLKRTQDALHAIRHALLLSPWYCPQVWLLGRDGHPPIEIPAEQAASTDDALLSLGRALLQNGDFGEALAVFDQVLVRDPAQPAALFHRGVVLAKLRRYGEALDDWETVERAAPASEVAEVSRRHARTARQLATLFAAA